MIFGGDDKVKLYRAAFEACGADMSVVKPWLKTYERTRKESIACMSRYYSGKENLNGLIRDLLKIEEMVRGYRELGPQEKNDFSAILRDLKKMQGSFDDEFLIGKDDKDFHTTLASVLKLGPIYLKKQEDAIIFQSEVENLLALAKEGVNRERPELFALSYFYIDHSNKELAEMNFAQKKAKVTEIFDREFKDKIWPELVKAVEKANSLSERLEGSTDRKDLKIFEEIGPLCGRVQEVFDGMCSEHN